MLEAVKLYLRIDHNHEDELLRGLIVAAVSFIKSGTGVEVREDNEKGMLIVKFLVAHWYENRQLAGQGSELPFSVTALMLQLETEKGD